MNSLVSAFELSLRSVLNAISPTDNAAKDWRMLCKAYDAHIQELTRSKVAELLKVDMQLVVELSKRIRASKKALERPSGDINDDINILRTIACVEFILKKDLSTSILGLDDTISENIATKQLRAIELSIRLVISNFYQNQDKLVSRLKVLFKSEAVNSWLSRSKDPNVLSGTILSELANIFTHPLEYPNYDFIYAETDCLTFLSDKRETLKLFLDDVRFIRNYIAHESKLSVANINLANIYYDQIIGPIQEQYDNGKILVNPESLVELKFESKIIYELNSVGVTAKDILIETKCISESVKKISDETKGLGEKTDKIKAETSGLKKKTKLILSSAVCIVLLLIVAAWVFHLGKKETSDNPRKELANMGVKWDPESMWNAMRNKDYTVVELFLRGGMSPYATFNEPLIWHAITNPMMDADVLIALYSKYRYDLNKKVVFHNEALALNLPHSMQGERTPLALAIESDKEVAIKSLLDAKVDIDLTMKDIEKDLEHVFGPEKADVEKGLAYFSKLTGRSVDGITGAKKNDNSSLDKKPKKNDQKYEQVSITNLNQNEQGKKDSISHDTVEPIVSNNSGPPQATDGSLSLNHSNLNRNSIVSKMILSTSKDDFNNSRLLASSVSNNVSVDTKTRAGAAKYSMLGNNFFNKIHDIKKALENYEQAYLLNKYSPEICGSYGYVLMNDGQSDKAENKLIESLELKPSYSSAWYSLGQLYGHRGDQEYSYACFVNACIFTKKVEATVKNLVTDSERPGVEALNKAAFHALTVCNEKLFK